MTSLTTNLSLTTYNSTTDQSGSFLSWTQAMSGSSNSNMTKIDTFAGTTGSQIAGLNTSISGSVTTVTNLMNSISGSMTTVNSNITTMLARFKKFYEFSGGGLIDVDLNDYLVPTATHILIIGVVAGNYGVQSMDVGIDFNGDANPANYHAVQWNRSKGGVELEYLQAYIYAQCILGTMPGTSAPGYGSTLFAFIPNYSASGGLYKTAMGICSWVQNANGMSSGTQGGVWKSTEPITRLRMFGSYNDTVRRHFNTGTKISFYGIG